MTGRLRDRSGVARSDLVVGVFTAIILAIVGWGLWKLGAWRQPDGYTIQARFVNAMGVKEEASVFLSGIKIGEVRDISLDLKTREAVLDLFIYEEYLIPVDSIVRIRSEGLLGSQAIEIVPGDNTAKMLDPGQTLLRSEKPTDVGELLDKLSLIADDIKKVSGSLADSLGSEDSSQNLAGTLKNIESLTRRLDEMVARNESNVDAFTGSMKDAASQLSTRLPEIAENIRVLSADLRDLVSENREGVGVAIERITSASEKLDKALGEIAEISEKVNDGKGTVGKLINDDETVNSLNKALDGVNTFLGKADTMRTYLSYRGEYLTRTGEFKNYLGVTIRPNPQKFYLIELISDPIGKREEVFKATTTTNTDGGTFYPGENIQTERSIRYDRDKFLFSLQLGYRIHDLTVRAGIMQDYGGVGFDYHLWDDRLKLTVEAYDFSRPDNNPVLRAYASFVFFDHLFVSAGGNDLLYDRVAGEKSLAEFFAGAGLTFEDEDLKFLLTSGGLPKPN